MAGHRALTEADHAVTVALSLMRRFLATILLSVALLPACGDDPQTTRPQSQPSSTVSAPAKPVVTVPAGDPPKELKTRDIEVGTGPAAKAGDKVVMHYVGVAWSTKKEFDASYNSGRPFPFTLGSGAVIPGWDQGIVGMRLGGRRELIIPPNLAYREQGSGPIGPNETLVFVVDLIQIMPS